MAATPATLPRHELVGRSVSVVEATDPTLEGLAGRVVRETTNTLVLETDDGARQVPKAPATFRFEFDDDRVRVAGDLLVARPARRTEQEVDTTWR